MNFLPIARLTTSSTAPLLKMTAVLLPSAGWILSGETASAQFTTTINPDTAQVQVDRNAIDIQTGPLGNTSNIPLPDGLPAFTRPRFSQPVIPDQLAPNSIEITPDVEYIEQSVRQQLQQEDSANNYTFDETSIELTTDFEFRRRRGSHGYAEGLEATVVDSSGVPQGETTSAFIRGDGVRLGPNGEALPDENELSVTYGAGETAKIRVVNVRRNNGAVRDSGVYFTESGELIAEDLQNGGDLDFDDGRFLTSFEGDGEIEATRIQTNTTEQTEVEETELEPETRREEILTTENIDGDTPAAQESPPVAGGETDETVEDIQADTTIDEITDRGEIDISQPVAAQIGHGRGARTAEGEQLIYDQYAPASGQIRAGSDGVTLSGQLSPIISNPNVAPTFITGGITFDPSANNNEAGLVGTARLTQFLTRTHRLATDMFGTQIENPVDEAPMLLEPTGWGSNRRLVGYVPATTDSKSENVMHSVDGVFTLPADQAVEITPGNSDIVGPGNSAYRNNVGGLLIEKADGSLSFVPQWTENEYVSETMRLSAGEATRIIYALVPEQPGQALNVGETYAVERGVTGGYQISAGGFTVIAANQQPQNFYREQVEVYAVEDTLPGLNTSTPEFNGIRGLYAEVPGGERQPTVDVQRAADADARVGNQLFAVSGVSGQRAYAQTTRAGGFYLGGALSLGIGNQQDTTTTARRAVQGVRTVRGFRLFETPLTQRDVRRIETIETIQNMGMTFFDINDNGEVENVRFVPGDIINRDVASQEIDRTTTIIRGEEVLVDTVIEETVESDALETDAVEQDEEASVKTDTYPNVSPLQGELTAGMVYNFGNTPWSAAANLVRAELFTRGMAFGQQGDIRAGWRSEVIFHPFGEVQREAFQYDEDGNTVPVYQTEPVLTADGKQLTESITTRDGSIMEVAVNQFVTNEEGARFTQSVGTGRAKGPGVYLRLENVFGDDDSLNVAAGLQLTF